MDPLAKVAEIMDDVEYLQGARWTEEQRTEFRQKYSLTTDDSAHRLRPETWAPADWYEAHSHHAEYGVSHH